MSAAVILSPSPNGRQPAPTHARDAVDEELLQAMAELLVEVDAVSFDFYDTLVTREGLFSPKDLFNLVNEEAERRWARALGGFTAMRVRAEQNARVRAHGRGLEEVTLEEIYVEVARVMGLTPDEARTLADVELECELRATRVLATGHALFEHACASGKPVVITSDTYLPHAFIEGLARREGYGAAHRIYVSSAHRRAKLGGSLFAAVLADLGCEPGRLLHVGDARLSDVTAALDAGVRALHVETPRQRWRARLGVSDEACGSRAMSAMLCRLADDSASTLDGGAGNTPSLAECARGLAVLYLGFATWLVEQIRHLGYRRVFFASREGAIIKRVFDLVAEAAGLRVESRYLYVSRASLYPSLIFTEQEHARYLFSRSWDRLTVADALARMSLSFDACRGQLAEQGLSRPDLALKGSIAQKFMAFLHAAWPLIAEANHERFALTLDYLRQEQVLTGERSAFIDIGWHGSLQYCIERLRAYVGLKEELHGLYLATFDWRGGAPPSTRASGYLLNRSEPPSIAPLVRASPPLIEVLFAAGHGRVLGYRREDEAVVATLEDLAWEREQFRQVVSPVQEEAFAFVAQHVAESAGSVIEAPDPRLVARMGLRTVYAPTPAEAAALGPLKATTDFGGPGKSLTGVLEYDLDRIAGEVLPDGWAPMWCAGFQTLKRMRRSQSSLRSTLS